jgi:glutaredoxin-related protein
MVYMKGVPEAPQCGFSAKVVQILAEHGELSLSSHRVKVYAKDCLPASFCANFQLHLMACGHNHHQSGHVK